MTEPLWLTDPMRCMIDPIDADTFFRDYHEKKSLIVKRNDPKRFLDLLSIERIDEIVANRDLRAGQLDMARSEEVRRIWPYLRDRRVDAYQDLTKRYRD